jgi:hypothetical protein
MLKMKAKRHFVLIAMCFLYSTSGFSFVLNPNKIGFESYEVRDHSIMVIENHWGSILLEGHDSEQMEVRAINSSSTPVEIKIKNRAKGLMFDVSVSSDTAPDKQVGLEIKFPKSKLYKLLVNSEGSIAVSNLEASGEMGIYTKEGKVNLENLKAGKGILVQSAKFEDVNYISTSFDWVKAPVEMLSSTSTSSSEKGEGTRQ